MSSSSSSTGAITCVGGIGVGGNIYVDGSINYIKSESVPTDTASITLTKEVSQITIGGTYAIPNYTESYPNVGRKQISVPNSSSAVEFGGGTSGIVLTLVVSGTNIYVGGQFSFVNNGSIAVGFVAKWNTLTSLWDTMGGGVDSFVNAIAVNGTDVYVGGNAISLAGGVVAVSNIAKWDGSAWSALSTGVSNGRVRTIVVNGSNVYVGGDFISPFNRFAIFNGTSWSSVDGGVSASVYAIAISGSDIYVGGDFLTAGSGPLTVNRIARISGGAWNTLNDGTIGVNGRVACIGVSGSDIYIGGDFLTAGSVSATRVARWNGTNWFALGLGADSDVWSMRINGSDIYIGGAFSNVDGAVASRLAKWDGSRWLSYTGTISSDIYAVDYLGGNIYCGGAFTTSYGISTQRLMYVSDLITVTLTYNSGANTTTLYAGGYVSLMAIRVGGSYQWLKPSQVVKKYGNTSFESINLVPTTTAPLFATAGDAYYNTSTGGIRVYNGTIWIDNLALTGGTMTGILNSTNSTNSTSTSTGAIVLSGGMGMAGNLFMGGSLTSTGANVNGTLKLIASSNISTISPDINTIQMSTTSTTAGLNLLQSGAVASPSATTSQFIVGRLATGNAQGGIFRYVYNGTLFSTPNAGANLSHYKLLHTGDLNVCSFFADGSTYFNGTALQYNQGNKTGNNGLRITDATTSTTTTTGALIVDGGAGIVGALNVGGAIKTTNTTASTTTTTGSLIAGGGAGIAGALNVGGAIKTTDATASTTTTTGSLIAGGGAGIAGALNVGGAIKTTDATASTTTTTGSLIANGGAGIAGALNVGGAIKTTDTTASTTTTTGSLIANGGAGIAGDVFIGGVLNFERMEVIPINTSVITLTKDITSIQESGSYSVPNYTGAYPYTRRKEITVPPAIWSALGSGANGTVNSLAYIGTDIYVGGSFTLAGGVANTLSIAKWDTLTSTWSALSTGTNGTVNAMTVIGTDLFVGGTFTLAGGITNTVRVAKWNGSAWSALSTGANGTVLAMTSIGTDLFIGGSFTLAGGIANTIRVAKWDGSVWSALSTGSNGDIFAMTSIGTDLYVGGNFSTFGTVSAINIAEWSTTGSVWLQLGSGVNNSVLALTSIGTDLYVGGSFGSAGGNSACLNVAKWDTLTFIWSSLGIGVVGTINTMTILGTDLYVGGNITFAGNIAVNSIAKWDHLDFRWYIVDAGTGATINASIYNGSALYVGGDFTTAGGNSVSKIAEWNTVTATISYNSTSIKIKSGGSIKLLSVPTNGIGTYLWELCQPADTELNTTATQSLVVSGDVDISGTLSYEKIDVIPTTASLLTLQKDITSIQQTNTYILPDYQEGFPNVKKKRIVLPDAWSALGAGIGTGTISAIAVGGTNVYVGGTFTLAGNITVNNIAVWNITTRLWSALGTGTSGTVSAVAVSGTTVYVGGTFTTAGGITVNNIAKWDTSTSTWSALGTTGVSGGSVFAIKFEGTNIYVGGSFTLAGGVASTVRIAKWSGTTWTALGTGIGTGQVNAITVESATSIYIAGTFTGAGGVANTVRITKWNGTVFSALGTGIGTNAVLTLAMDGTAVYVGGTFTGAGGVANTVRIARWTGAAWTALVATVPAAANGISANAVNAIAVVNSTTVYVGGSFVSSGTPIFNYIMKWNGSNTWSGLGAGLNNTVNALALNGTDLYADGLFTTTDDITLNFVARFIEPISATITYNSGVDSLTLSSGGEVEFTSLPIDGQNDYRWKMIQSVDIETNKTRFNSINVKPGLMPPNGVAGDVYYDSTTNKLRCHNGTIWNDLF